MSFGVSGRTIRLCVDIVSSVKKARAEKISHAHKVLFAEDLCSVFCFELLIVQVGVVTALG